jgi:hypothetical protein
VLYGGAPHYVAAAYAVIGWHMVLFGTALGLISAWYASEGEFAALLPLPLVVISFGLALHSLRHAAVAIRSVMR